MTKRNILVSLLAFMFVVTGCDIDTSSNASYRLNQNEVDPRFREFYDWLGGEEILGPAISSKFRHEGYEYQYTATALLVFVPNALDDQRYQLAPLGNELGVAEPPLNPDTPGEHEVYPSFMVLYTKIGGERVVGLPITDARYNVNKGRIEQFFEKVGFYHLETDFDDVHLLQYGAWKCADHCGYDPLPEAEIVLLSSVGTSFDAAVQRLNPGFTGYPLTEPYIASDGELEQIFENVVIITDPDNPGNIRLRPILSMIGIPIEESGNSIIPEIFYEFINRNSGLEFSGQPVSEYAALSSEVYRQCFTNLCLDYFPNAAEGLRVRPAPLGYTYKSLHYHPGSTSPGTSQPRQITLRVWETSPLLPGNQRQEIGVRVESDVSPLINYSPNLTLTIPNVGEKKYIFPPTNQAGTSFLELEPIDAPNGTRIEYQVCVNNQDNESFCIVDDFMIWPE